MNCPNCGIPFQGAVCNNVNCDDPWSKEAIESMDEAIKSAQTKPSRPWEKIKKGSD